MQLVGNIRIDGIKQFNSILRTTAALGHDWDLRLAGVLSSVVYSGTPLDSDPLSDWVANLPSKLADSIQSWHSHSRLLVASWLHEGASPVQVEDLYVVVEAVEEVRSYVSDWRMKQSDIGATTSPINADEGGSTEIYDDDNSLFRIGESVVILDGPFATLSGVVKSLGDGLGYFSVDIEIFGRTSTVECSSSQLTRGS